MCDHPALVITKQHPQYHHVFYSRRFSTYAWCAITLPSSSLSSTLSTIMCSIPGASVPTQGVRSPCPGHHKAASSVPSCVLFQALQYLRKVCDHPALVITKQHPQYHHVFYSRRFSTYARCAITPPWSSLSSILSTIMCSIPGTSVPAQGVRSPRPRHH